jgi:hypothetical protein
MRALILLAAFRTGWLNGVWAAPVNVVPIISGVADRKIREHEAL